MLATACASKEPCQTHSTSVRMRVHAHNYTCTHQPDGEGRAPEAGPGDAPVTSTLQPVVKAFVAHVLWHPVGFLQVSIENNIIVSW